MDSGEGFFGGGDEAFAVAVDHGPFRPLAEAGDGFAAVAAGADDFRHLIGVGLAVSDPEFTPPPYFPGNSTLPRGVFLKAS